jgi:AhpD family alkylhydroperoxidase
MSGQVRRRLPAAHLRRPGAFPARPVAHRQVDAGRACPVPARAGIAAGFRERIMLVVTGVNRCRHCAWGHEILAHQVGLSKVEIASLLVLWIWRSCPDSEIPGLAVCDPLDRERRDADADGAQNRVGSDLRTRGRTPDRSGGADDPRRQPVRQHLRLLAEPDHAGAIRTAGQRALSSLDGKHQTCHAGLWCARRGSNPQPLASEASTLSIELRARGGEA